MPKKSPFPQFRCKRFKGGGRAFYFDTLQTPRKWIKLGSDEEVAIREWKRLRERGKAHAGTVAKLLAEYLDYLEDEGKGAYGRVLAAGTLKNYRRFSGYLANVLGLEAPERITQKDVQNWLLDCKRKTAKGEIAFLSGAYQWGMRKKGLTFNPCAGVHVALEPSKRDRVPTHDEMQRIYTWAETHNEKLCVLLDIAYMTGMRRGDAVRVRADQFGDETFVRAQKTKKRQGWLLTPALQEVLDEARALQGRIGSVYVLAKTNGQPYRPDSVSLWFRQAVRALGIEDLRLHDVRARSITDKEEQDGMEAAQEFAQHSDLATTRGYVRGKRVTVVTPLRRVSRM